MWLGVLGFDLGFRLSSRGKHFFSGCCCSGTAARKKCQHFFFLAVVVQTHLPGKKASRVDAISLCLAPCWGMLGPSWLQLGDLGATLALVRGDLGSWGSKTYKC